MLDNLASVFGMQVINVENVILQNLARKVEDPDPARIVNMVQALLKVRDPHSHTDSLATAGGGSDDDGRLVVVVVVVVVVVMVMIMMMS